MATLIKRSNGIYYQIVNFHGRQIWKSTGVRSLIQAKKVIANNFKKDVTPVDLTLTQYANQFLQYAETNFAPGTRMLYDQAI
jgi:hypothetical protein